MVGGLKTETGKFLLHFQNSKSSNRCRSVYGTDIMKITNDKTSYLDGGALLASGSQVLKKFSTLETVQKLLCNTWCHRTNNNDKCLDSAHLPKRQKQKHECLHLHLGYCYSLDPLP